MLGVPNPRRRAHQKRRGVFRRICIGATASAAAAAAGGPRSAPPSPARRANFCRAYLGFACALAGR